jgi:hypothetical protein
MSNEWTYASEEQLRAQVKFWKRLCAMLATLLLACAVVIVLAYFKLP